MAFVRLCLSLVLVPFASLLFVSFVRSFCFSWRVVVSWLGVVFVFFSSLVAVVVVVVVVVCVCARLPYVVGATAAAYLSCLR